MTARQNVWLRKRFTYLKEASGNICSYPDCKEMQSLQFAHLFKTELSGRGRGRAERYYDIINNLDKYVLLCEEHHELLDDYLKDNPEELKKVQFEPLMKIEKIK